MKKMHLMDTKSRSSVKAKTSIGTRTFASFGFTSQTLKLNYETVVLH